MMSHIKVIKNDKYLARENEKYSVYVIAQALNNDIERGAQIVLVTA